MNRTRNLLAIMLTTLLGIAAVSPSWAQEWRTETMSVMDRRYMEQQRATIDELARRHLGEQLQGDERDLAIIQQLLDQRLIAADDTATLQALGAVLGDQLERELNLRWTVYVDQRGRSRALEIPGLDEFLFPMTMISRRAEAGAEVDVQAIYDKAVGIVEEVRNRSAPF